MNEQTGSLPVIEPCSQLELSRKSKGSTWLELGVVLLVMWVPGVYYGAVGYFSYGASAGHSLMQDVGVGNLLRDTGYVALLLYLLMRNGVSLASVGLVRYRLLRDTYWAFMIVGFMFSVVWLANASGLQDLVSKTDLIPVSRAPKPTSNARFVLPLMFLTGAVFEETLFRGYLLMRLCQMLGSRFFALVIASVVFAIPHIYEGVMGVAVMLIFGAGMSCAFLYIKRLGPLVLAHFLFNMAGYAVEFWLS